LVSLVTSARDALADGDETDGRWVDGFSFRPALNVDPTTCSAAAATRRSLATSRRSHSSTRCRGIQVAEHCSVMGYRGNDYIGRAVDALAAATPKGVEFEFWTGDARAAKGWPNLLPDDGNAEDVTPTPGTAVSAGRGDQPARAGAR
jgi:hypothetical protein